MTACPFLPSLRQTFLWDHMVYGSLLAPSPQVLKRASLPSKPIIINSYARDTFQTWRHGKCDAGEGGENLEVIGRRALSEEAFLIQLNASAFTESSPDCKTSIHQTVSL